MCTLIVNTALPRIKSVFAYRIAGTSGNTFTALIVPFLVSTYYIYLLRQNFKQVPNELYLAAKVDGTSDMKYLIKVMIPLALPTIITITILKMMGSWNSYVWPRLVANDDLHKLITNGLRGTGFTVDGGQEVNYPVQMAAVAIVSAPLFIVFLCFRKYIMRGVSRSGIDLERFDWSRFDLIVIDESHNFRNRTEKEESETRYQRR